MSGPSSSGTALASLIVFPDCLRKPSITLKNVHHRHVLILLELLVCDFDNVVDSLFESLFTQNLPHLRVVLLVAQVVGQLELARIYRKGELLLFIAHQIQCYRRVVLADQISNQAFASARHIFHKLLDQIPLFLQQRKLKL